MRLAATVVACALLTLALPVRSYGDAPAIDPAAAQRAIAERQRLCEADNGKLWGVSLCGPFLFVDPATRQVVGNYPNAALPAGVIPANTAFPLGDGYVTMVMWPITDEPIARNILLMHESWHRIQRQIGLPPAEGNNDHLDTFDGRYWMLLEWRALARAATLSGSARRAAVLDALGFAAQRHQLIRGSGIAEANLLRNEGLAEDTGVALSTAPRDRMVRVVEELARYRGAPSLVRSFAYGAGPAYGAFLDLYRPGWRRTLNGHSDLYALLAAALHTEPSAATATKSVAAYDDGSLRTAEQQRETRRVARLAALRATYVDGPVLRIPLRGANFGFNPNAVVPFPGFGNVYTPFNATGWFGHLDAPGGALVTSDYSTVIVPAPKDATTLSGSGWKLTPASTCTLEAAERAGDFTVHCPAT